MMKALLFENYAASCVGFTGVIRLFHIEFRYLAIDFFGCSAFLAIQTQFFTAAHPPIQFRLTCWASEKVKLLYGVELTMAQRRTRHSSGRI